MIGDVDDLIAASSVGAGLANIRENGIDAELARLDEDMAPKKRHKSTSPTARTLAECRKREWPAGVVEKFVRFPPPGHHVDLFGVIDVVAIVCEPAAGWSVGTSTIGIQACAGGNGDHSRRRAKILAEPRARQWVEAGNRLELWSWSKRGDRGKRKLWALRVERFAIVDGQLVGIEAAR